MVELKIKDVESLEAIVRALQKNGYPCNSSIHWGKGKINYFSIQLDLMGGTKSDYKQHGEGTGSYLQIDTWRG